MTTPREKLDNLTDALVESILEAGDEEIRAEAIEDGICLACGGWGKLFKVSREVDYARGARPLGGLPCAECSGTGRASQQAV